MTRGTASVDFCLYLITDRGQTGGRDLLTVVEEALSGGVRGVQFREKALSTREYFELAREMRGLTARYGARLLINDRVDIARAVGADGVHLPEAGLPLTVARELLGPAQLIGVSCHSLETALHAEQHGADFITFGPVWFTPSKARYGDPVKVASLAGVAHALSIPVFALGGVTRERVPELLATGIRRVALISSILADPAPKTEAEAFISLLTSDSRQ
jgi:thiamine-phosphate pyrophosphorylase